MKTLREATSSVSRFKSIFYHIRRGLNTAGRTIFALSSGRGKCGVAVVRVSGSKCRFVLSALAGDTCISKPRMAQLRTLRDPQSREILDRAIVIWFPGPKSFTGEDSCEFQVHGGLAVISGLLDALGKIPGLYPADPGEFSKRAFFNGSMDLTEAEGLADLIHAETEMQRKQALHQMSGSLHKLYNRWRTDLTKIVAHVEAYIDFSEDDNIEDDVMHSAKDSVAKLTLEIQTHLSDGRCGQRLRDGVKATIIGVPNVGKSSLLNLLCERPAAIVTSIAGTTRDVVEQHINISGYPLSLADTAGIRGDLAVHDLVEKEGITRAKQFAQSADVILLVIDSEECANHLTGDTEQDNQLFREFVKLHMSHLGLDQTFKGEVCVEKNETPQINNIRNDDAQCIIILSKTDLMSDTIKKDSLCHLEKKFKNVALLSCVTGDGLPQLLHKLKTSLQILCGNPKLESPALSQLRHRQHLMNCQDYLQKYLQKTSRLHDIQSHQNMINDVPEMDLAICAEDLRIAIHHLGRITGHVTTEQILDVIFKEFCIGK